MRRDTLAVFAKHLAELGGELQASLRERARLVLQTVPLLGVVLVAPLRIELRESRIIRHASPENRIGDSTERRSESPRCVIDRRTRAGMTSRFRIS